jgi:hypothetical protein
LDLGLVPFDRPALRLLWAPTQTAQEAPHVVYMVGYAEAIADEPGYAGASPQIRGKPRCLGALEQEPLEALLGPSVQLGGSAWGGFGPQAIVTGFPEDPIPAPHTSTIHCDQTRHFEGLMALQEQLDGPNSATFQFLWASVRSHRLPPAQSIGH